MWRVEDEESVIDGVAHVDQGQHCYEHRLGDGVLDFIPILRRETQSLTAICYKKYTHKNNTHKHNHNGSLNLIWFILAHVFFFSNSCHCLYALVGEMKFIYLFINVFIN